ncbi:RtcB family protein [Candidatus Uhrbacteria bacterium]|nr:RtcB family protein [Candidatus Uhrbacteria bacterium]
MINGLKKINDFVFEIPRSHRPDMRVPGRIYSDEKLLKEISEDRSIEQLINVATLPGIQKYAIAMPDMHEGYGFPIGGVAAISSREGVVSPGGVGYDINCGVRLLRSPLTIDEIKPFLEELAHDIYRTVPSGVGRGGKLKFAGGELDEVLRSGAAYMVERDYGTEEDLERCEEGGSMAGANPILVSSSAKARGSDQLGTLGSGNHFLEIQAVDEVYDAVTAKAFGLERGQITVAIHCGSRGLGHQVATDYIRIMLPKLDEWGIILPDRELSCAPVNSKEGQNYLSAMAGAANFAWANRHVIAHLIRQSWNYRLSGRFGDKSALELVYDVAHNIAKREEHEIGGKTVEVIMHRKGATRAFGPGRMELPEIYRRTGQPVLIPGTMGTASYVLCGTHAGMSEAFGTSCHGAGRRMSRAAAKKKISGAQLRQELERRGIVVRCDSNTGLAEEAPEAYKDVDEVVEITVRAGLAGKVAKLRPVAVIKGG